jgi:hypothetical protein
VNDSNGATKRGYPMSWLTQLIASLAPPVTGLRVEEANPIAVRLPPPPGRIFRALSLLLDPGAVLYWEGRADRTLAAWLRRQTADPRPSIAIGVVPVSDFYRFELDDELLEELAARVERPNAIGRRVWFHVLQAERIVVEWRPAFGSAPLLLSRLVPADRVSAFIRATEALPVGSADG